jgi:hypothetical protein
VAKSAPTRNNASLLRWWAGPDSPVWPPPWFSEQEASE